MERAELSNNSCKLQEPSVVLSNWDGRAIVDQYIGYCNVNFLDGQLQERGRFGLPHPQLMAKRGDVRFTISFTENITKRVCEAVHTTSYKKHRLESCKHIYKNEQRTLQNHLSFEIEICMY